MRTLTHLALFLTVLLLCFGKAQAEMGSIERDKPEAWVCELVEYLVDLSAVDASLGELFKPDLEVGPPDVYALVSQAAASGAEKNDPALTLCALHLALHYQDWIIVTGISVEQRDYPRYITSNSFPEAMFTLVPADHWAYNAISYLQEHGMLQSYRPDYFDGRELRSRYQFAMAVDSLLTEWGERENDPKLHESGLDRDQLNIMLETLRAEFSEQLAELSVLGAVEETVNY